MGRTIRGRLATLTALLALSFTLIILPSGIAVQSNFQPPLSNDQSTPTSFGIHAAASAAPLQGDVNCSGGVDAVDALLILRSVAGLSSGDCVSQAGNVDCSISIDAVDALEVLRFVAGLPADTPGCTPIGQPAAPPPTSEQLIDEAVQRGEISSETGLTYKVFTLFGDERLPEHFKGVVDFSRSQEVMADVANTFSDLPSETQDVLAPFLMPPYAEGSWLSRQVGAGGVAAAASFAASPCPHCPAVPFKNTVAVPSKVRVWWQERHPEDQAKAQAIAQELADSYPRLTEYMGREPLSDEAEPLNGGDGLLDFYLVDLTDYRGVTIPYGREVAGHEECKSLPAFILLNRSISPPEMFPTPSHELFHAIQGAFSTKLTCYNIKWLMESTATWAQDFLYPDNNREHERNMMFKHPQVSMNTLEMDSYSTYLWFLFLTRGFDEGIVRQVWQNIELADEHADPLAVLDQLIPGGFKVRWPEFSLFRWNYPPVDRFAEWDGIPDHPSTRDLLSAYTFGIVDVTLDGAAEKKFEPERSSVDRLSAQYYHFRIADPQVRSLVARNPFGSRVPQTASVQALIKVTGEDWRVEDWTHSKGESFCRDEDGRALEELVVIVSNSDFAAAAYVGDFTQPLLTAYNRCGWHGTSTTTYHPTSLQANLVAKGTDLVFEEEAGGTFKIAQGKVEWSISGFDNNGCKLSGEPVVVDLSPADAQLQTTVQEDGSVSYSLSGSHRAIEINVHTRPSGNCTWSGESTICALQEWLESGQQLSADPGDLSGQAVSSGPLGFKAVGGGCNPISLQYGSQWDFDPGAPLPPS